MKYFFFIYVMAVVLIVTVAGVRGTHGPNRPLQFFPDMVFQSKVKPQQPSKFFADGVASRTPVDGVVPMGFDFPTRTAASVLKQANGVQSADAHERLAFSEGPDYYDTGMIGDQWGTGIPLEVTPALLERGQQRFTINCAVCHGATGSGNGVTSKYGLANIANYHDPKYLKMADGEIFYTITNGHNSMNGYGANVTVRDRWAIICYIRALQHAQEVKPDELPPAEKQTVLAAQP